MCTDNPSDRVSNLQNDSNKFKFNNKSSQPLLPITNYGSIPSSSPPPPPPTNSPTVSTFPNEDSDLNDNSASYKSKNPIFWYMYLLETYPLRTKVITSTILSVISDIIAQRFENVPFAEMDLRRLMAMGIVGAVLTAPLFHVLYEALELYLPTHRNKMFAFVHLLVDQLIGDPIWLFIFFYLNNFCEGVYDLDVIADNLQRDILTSLKASWLIFPGIQLLNFSIVPTNMRVLVINIVDLAYTSILSYVKHRPMKQS